MYPPCVTGVPITHSQVPLRDLAWFTHDRWETRLASTAGRELWQVEPVSTSDSKVLLSPKRDKINKKSVPPGV